MSHKHWPKDHPFYERAATCPLLKRECDVLWRQYQHGHEGRPCENEILPGNSTPTCVLTYTDEELQRRRSKTVR